MVRYSWLATIVASAVLTACGGGGGGSAPLPDNAVSCSSPQVLQNGACVTTSSPKATLRSSYENKTAAITVVGAQYLPEVAGSTFMVAYAYADFTRSGSYSLVASYSTYTWPNGALSPSKIRFFKQNGSGWSDITASLLDDDTGCVFARKALVADFNGDSKPDVFFACNGVDAPPYGGEQQRILLSQPDGTYKNTLLPFSSYSHGGAAADFSGDGFADVVLGDLSYGRGTYYLKNNRDGTFTEVPGALPLDAQSKPALSVELLDINDDGTPDLWTSGDTNASGVGNNPPAYYLANSVGSFQLSERKEIPTTITGLEVGVDIVKVGKYLYTSFEFDNWQSMRVEAFDVNANVSTEIYSHSGSYPTYYQGWFPYIAVVNGAIIPTDKNWQVSIPLLP